MLNWKFFCDQLEIARLVPAEYAAFREPIADAVVFFLENLPPQRTEAILRELLSSADLNSVETQLIVLARHCPTLQKLGQVLARDRRLAPTLRGLLQTLESMPPRGCPQAMRETIVADLGPLEQHGLELADVALAEASVAVVIPFTWRDAPAHLPSAGVFKVLKPEIEEHLNLELEILERIGEFLDERCHDYGIPRLDFADTFSQVKERLRCEVQLQQEQRNLVAAGEAYRDDSRIVVPQLLPFCSRRITAMERIEGRKVTDLQGVQPGDRRRLARLIVEALIAAPVWSSAATLFHADPHAGNLFRTPENRLVLFDWSLTGTLCPEDAIGMSQILIGALTLDHEQTGAALSHLSRRQLNDSALSTVIDDALRAARHAVLPGLDWLIAFLDDAVGRAGAAFSTDLLMFRKVLHTLEGVVADVDADCNVDAILAASFLACLSREWNARMVSPPFSRAFPSHLSNADLARVVTSAPLTAVRFWTGWMRDWLTVP